jgi:hypothetical protein
VIESRIPEEIESRISKEIDEVSEKTQVPNRNETRVDKKMHML